jgi:hypothetical protein
MIEADTFDEWAIFAEQLYAPNAVWDTGGHPGRLEGRDAIVAFVYEGKLEEFGELGNRVIFYLLFHRGRPAGGSGFVELRHANTTTCGDGLFQRTLVLADIDQARAAAERLAQERG